MISLHGNRPHVWSALLGKTMEDSVERSMAMRAKIIWRKKAHIILFAQMERRRLCAFYNCMCDERLCDWKTNNGTCTGLVFPKYTHGNFAGMGGF